MANRSQSAYRGPTAVGRSIQLYLADQLRALDKIAPGLVRADPEAFAEAVHDMRVTCQQMRSVLAAFSQYLEPRTLRRLDRRASRLQKAFSELRDRHILLSQPELVPELRQQLERQQAKAMQGFRDGPEYHRICRLSDKLRDELCRPDLEERLSPEPLTPKGIVQMHRLQSVLPAVLYHLAAAVTAYRSVVSGSLEPLPAAPEPVDRFWESPSWPAADTLHRLRLSFKQLRHVLLMLCPLWGSLGDDLIATSKQMQDRLGYLHDRQVLAQALDAFCHSEDADGPARASVEAVWPVIRSTHETALRDFLGNWQTMDLAWFHSQLLPLVAWSAQQSSAEGCQADTAADHASGETGPSSGPASGPAHGLEPMPADGFEE